jgi:hypothetical protein
VKTKATWILPASILAWNSLLSTCGMPGMLDGHRIAVADDGGAVRKDAPNAPSTVAEARGRARLLHETIHGALQVMHRDFFREDEKLAIPSRSLEDVFRELTRSYGVEVRWLAVNTEAMNVDHKARTEFEKNAVRELASGKEEYEASDDEVYRHAGVIRLSSQCLKCHVPNRTSTRDRAAGLVITMPLLERRRDTQ